VSGELAQACEELGSWLAIAETLTALPDIEPGGRRAGKPGSRPPGNQAALGVIMDAHAGVRALEAEFRFEVTGTRRPRGGSGANTEVALSALPDLADAVPVQHEAGRPCRCAHCEALRQVGRWALAVRQLPAVDDAPRWVKLRAGPDGLPPRCPFCETFSLRLAVESGEIWCWFPGCEDGDGNQPKARVEISRIGGIPVLAWSSGLVQ